ncbi:MAG TPA: uroporphyrinogen-III synthase [Stellaceae bacterium]|nr:uroporphyrinogen-III synthase [Stellaceae bacterium]
MKAHEPADATRAMRALLTRPRREAEALAALLARRGIAAVVEPMIEIVERADAAVALAGVQALLCTSANGVRALARASVERRLPLLAVGDATARAARAAGFADVASAGGDVADLAALAARRLRPEAGRLVHVAGSDRAGDLAGALERAGFAVERAVLYEARAATALSPAVARLIAQREIDLALFFSPRTAAVFARLAAAAGIAGGLAATTALSISAAADAALGALPFRDRAIAGSPTQAALLALVDRIASAPLAGAPA